MLQNQYSSFYLYGQQVNNPKPKQVFYLMMMQCLGRRLIGLKDWTDHKKQETDGWPQENRLVDMRERNGLPFEGWGAHTQMGEGLGPLGGRDYNLHTSAWKGVTSKETPEESRDTLECRSVGLEMSQSSTISFNQPGKGS